jgi:hypothetical protein
VLRFVGSGAPTGFLQDFCDEHVVVDTGKLTAKSSAQRAQHDLHPLVERAAVAIE